MRTARRSRERGVYKECTCQWWDRCAHPWLLWEKPYRRVNLAKWAGVGKRTLNRSEAIGIATDARAAIRAGEFNPKGKASTIAAGARTFGQLLDDFDSEYVAKRQADGKLRSTSHAYYVAKFRAEFGAERVSALEQTHRRFE